VSLSELVGEAPEFPKDLSSAGDVARTCRLQSLIVCRAGSGIRQTIRRRSPAPRHGSANQSAKIHRGPLPARPSRYGFGSLAPLWCCQAYPACFSTFSCFVGQRSCQNFGLELELVLTVGTFPLVAQVLKLEWDKAASYPACQVLTAQDARYASLKRNERAQSTNGL
jgi:hypothetical protein